MQHKFDNKAYDAKVLVNGNLVVPFANIAGFIKFENGAVINTKPVDNNPDVSMVVVRQNGVTIELPFTNKLLEVGFDKIKKEGRKKKDEGKIKH